MSFRDMQDYAERKSIPLRNRIAELEDENERLRDLLQTLIDAPLPPTDRLRHTLKTKAPWDHGEVTT